VNRMIIISKRQFRVVNFFYFYFYIGTNATWEGDLDRGPTSYEEEEDQNNVEDVEDIGGEEQLLNELVQKVQVRRNMSMASNDYKPVNDAAVLDYIQRTYPQVRSLIDEMEATE
jgi:hypothetical protein